MKFYILDINKYIASGILENYVLGLANEKESQEVERYAEQYPEIRAELDAIEIALESYAQIHKVKAPKDTLQNVFAKLDKTSPKASPKKSEIKTNGGTNLLSILLGIALLGTLVATWFVYQQSTQKTTEINQLNQQLQQLQTDCDEKEQDNLFLREQLQILRNGNYQEVPMRGLPEKAPNAVATVHYNIQDQKVYLDVQTLPTPPSNRQYQLWAIVEGNPDPVSMGVFDLVVDRNALQEVPFIPNAQAFAVTLEPTGGSPTPTLTEMYVIGNLNS